jgi:hypothetical protein
MDRHVPDPEGAGSEAIRVAENATRFIFAASDTNVRARLPRPRHRGR